jgi:hypothetical protein
MDPQMVWDAMDEEEAKCDSHRSMSQMVEEKSEETPQSKMKRSAFGWMGVPVYGVGR